MSFGKDRRTLLAVFIVLLIAFEMIAYVSTTPRQQQRFFQLFVLGANHMAADYYPNNDPNIRLGESVRWYIGVTNLMGNAQLAVVRIKLGNWTITPPNDLRGTPSPAPLLAEFTRFIRNSETWEFVFAWQIIDALSVGNSTRILQLGINNQTFQLQDSSATNGHNFRFTIELWTWNTESQALQFGWQVGREHRVAWLQLWFNAATPLR